MATDTGFGRVRLFDDFLGDQLQDEWVSALASGATAFASNAQVNGVLRGTVADDSSNDYSVLYGELNYQADDAGPLIFECRIKPVTSIVAMYYVGLSDEKTTEIPMDFIGASTQTTTATDAVGFYYTGGETSATWRYGGVKNGSDSTHYACSSVYDPVVGTWQTFKVVVATDGAASFFIDGNIIREDVADCVTASTSLMPYICLRDDGAAASLDVDYIYMSKGRV